MFSAKFQNLFTRNTNFKKTLIATVLIAAIPVAYAQVVKGEGNKPDMYGQHMQMKEEMMQNRFDEVAKKLNLSAEQVSALKAEMQSNRQAMQVIHDSREKRLVEILGAEKADQLKAEMRQGHGKKHRVKGKNPMGKDSAGCGYKGGDKMSGSESCKAGKNGS